MQTILTILTNGKRFALGGLFAVRDRLASLGTVSVSRPARSSADSAMQDEVAEQNKLLKEALDTMTQGFCVFDADNCLVLWNNRFADMYAIQGKLRICAPGRWRYPGWRDFQAHVSTAGRAHDYAL